jgi:uncharacterized UBP type Zn finger protein
MGLAVSRLAGVVNTCVPGERRYGRLMTECAHIADVPRRDGVLGPAPTSQGCEECLAMGSSWLHLRRCLHCGGVRCCDDSPNQHASRHARAEGHVLMQSFEPGEDWIWCFADEVSLHLPEAVDSPSYTP